MIGIDVSTESTHSPLLSDSPTSFGQIHLTVGSNLFCLWMHTNRTDVESSCCSLCIQPSSLHTPRRVPLQKFSPRVESRSRIRIRSESIQHFGASERDRAGKELRKAAAAAEEEEAAAHTHMRLLAAET